MAVLIIAMHAKLPSLVVWLALTLSAAPIRAADGETMTPKELAAARKLYSIKCLKCHESHDPKKYSPAEWDEWLYKMNRKAKLRPEPADLIKRYTAILREEPAKQ